MKWFLFRGRGLWHLSAEDAETGHRTRCGRTFALNPELERDTPPENLGRVCWRCLKIHKADNTKAVAAGAV